MVTGKTQVFGLIGNPVAQSFSPFIHNSLAQALGIDMTYVTFPVARGSLKDAYRGMKALGIRGMNVTVPYKGDIMAELDGVDEAAAKIGAVNTLVYEGEQVKGYNTDWIGLWRSLERRGVGLKGRRVLILGAGGSARATAVMAAKYGAVHITVANRTLEKAQAITRLIGNTYSVKTSACSIEEAEITEGYEVIFQTTSLGMYPKTEGCPIRKTRCLNTADVAVDLIYNPEETQFLAAARQAGCQTINGMEMLFFQAVRAFELWQGQRVPEDVENRCLADFKDAVAEKNNGTKP